MVSNDEIVLQYIDLLYVSNDKTVSQYIDLLQLGLCDNGKTYISIMPIMHYKIILINDSYRNKIMIGYYAYILDFCNSKLLCVLMYLYVSCSIQWYPEIYYYHDNKIIIFITIMNLLSR